jgi:hypothetical protein
MARDTTVTPWPRVASNLAIEAPAGPPPMTVTSLG